MQSLLQNVGILIMLPSNSIIHCNILLTYEAPQPLICIIFDVAVLVLCEFYHSTASFFLQNNIISAQINNSRPYVHTVFMW